MMLGLLGSIASAEMATLGPRGLQAFATWAETAEPDAINATSTPSIVRAIFCCFLIRTSSWLRASIFSAPPTHARTEAKTSNSSEQIFFRRAQLRVRVGEHE